MTSVNFDRAIAHMNSLAVRGVRYSMNGSRTGTDGTADCSGAIYSALLAAGMPSAGWVLNTEYEHDWLLENGWSLIEENGSFTPQKGDVFIWGKKGRSAGGFGHTGIFVDDEHILHCNYRDNGVALTGYQERWIGAGRPYHYLYRFGGHAAVVTPGTNYNPDSKWGKLVLDGEWGVAVTQALQRYFNTPVDGIISGQDNPASFAIWSVQHAHGGSQLVAKMQARMGITVDGYIGRQFIRRLQELLGTPVDGIISRNSKMVIALQKALNDGKLPF